MKNPFKRSKGKFPTAQVPRSLDDIKKVYNELSAKAGQIQYNVFVLNQELAQINNALISVNQEAGARQNLDKEAAKTAESSAQ